MNHKYKSITSEVLIKGSDTIHIALKRMDKTAMGILLLVDDDGILVRSVTDGDLRRLMLARNSLDEALNTLPEQKPIVSSLDASTQSLLALMNQHGINQVILVDAKNKPLAIALRKDIDTSILLSPPHLGNEERTFVNQAFNTNWIAPVGPNIDAFEQELAEKVGVAYAVALSSGTAAIHLALRVLGVGHGDTVFCSSFTFVASVNPILYQNAEPIFIDSDYETWNMSPQALARALKEADDKGCLPKAIIVVHLYGQSADMDEILALCDRYNVPVVEDAAESLGATYKRKLSGTMGKLGIYSFNGNKIITTSGGGMLVTNDKTLAQEAKFLSTQAKEDVAWYEHAQVGYNYRMSNILAGVGRGQLKVLDDRIDARRKVFDNYLELFESESEIEWMPEANFGRANRWLSVLLMPEDSLLTVNQVVEAMNVEKIEVRPVWKPMHQQPLFKGRLYYPHEIGNSVCDKLFMRGLCLPSGSNMSLEQQHRVVDTLRQVLKENV